MQKMCNYCNQIKSLNLFGKYKRVKSGIDSICKECKNKKLREYRKQNYQKFRFYDIKRHYNLTPIQYQNLFKYGNKCTICLETFKNKNKATVPHIDHCHNTGAIRGILCKDCNTGLGHFRDTIPYLYRAYQYLMGKI